MLTQISIPKNTTALTFSSDTVKTRNKDTILKIKEELKTISSVLISRVICAIISLISRASFQFNQFYSSKGWKVPIWITLNYFLKPSKCHREIQIRRNIKRLWLRQVFILSFSITHLVSYINLPLIRFIRIPYFIYRSTLCTVHAGTKFLMKNLNFEFDTLML